MYRSRVLSASFGSFLLITAAVSWTAAQSIRSAPRAVQNALRRAARTRPASQDAGGVPLVIHTKNGVVRGYVAEGQRAFLGIPFGAPPVGPLRWRPTAPAASWTGVLDATQFGNFCAQWNWDADGNMFVDGSEDCLNLNVYTPLNAAPTPSIRWSSTSSREATPEAIIGRT
jgi:hypothetical protein